MTKSALIILRLGLGITFLWIGIMIWQDPLGWGTFIRPWALALLPVPLSTAMLGTAVLDIAIGALLLINVFPWLGAALAAGHLAVVLVTSGVNSVTVRDVGLLGASLALAIQTWPEKYKFWLKK